MTLQSRSVIIQMLFIELNLLNRVKVLQLTHGSLVVSGPFIEKLTAVFLRSDGGGQVDGNHLEQGFSGREPAPHYSLQQGLPLLFFVLRVKFDIQLFNEFGCLFFFEIHDGIKHLRGQRGKGREMKALSRGSNFSAAFQTPL